MSDQIADILEDHFGQNHLSEEIDSVAKQIRQQIGRELLEKRMQLDDFVHCDYIREVCQLEES